MDSASLWTIIGSITATVAVCAGAALAYVRLYVTTIVTNTLKKEMKELQSKWMSRDLLEEKLSHIDSRLDRIERAGSPEHLDKLQTLMLRMEAMHRELSGDQRE